MTKRIVGGPVDNLVVTGAEGRSPCEKLLKAIQTACTQYEHTHVLPQGFPLEVFGKPSLIVKGRNIFIHRSTIDILRGPRALVLLTLRLQLLKVELNILKSIRLLK